MSKNKQQPAGKPEGSREGDFTVPGETAPPASTAPAAPSAEKHLEQQLMQEGDDLAFDPRLMAPAPPAVAPATQAALVSDPNFADTVATKTASAIAAAIPNPRDTMLMVGEIVKQVVLALREPTEEQKLAEARKKRDRSQAIKEQREMIEARQQAQEMCPHETATSDGKTHTNITAVHNFADGVLRGICSICGKLIEPGDQFFGIVVAQHNQAVRSMHAGITR